MKNASNIVKLSVVGAFLSFACFAVQGLSTAQNRPASDGPTNQGTRAARQDGDERSGRDVFRFETFGNEGFWTDAVRLPAGVVAAKVTPLQALQLGLQVDVDALDDATRKAVAAELKKDPTGRSSALFNDPSVTVKLLNANAVAGMVVKDGNGDGRLDVGSGDKVGASCSLCHAPLGLRVDDRKLLDLNAYLVNLPAPRGVRGDGRAMSRGRDLFRTAGCTTCHNVDQGKPVPAGLVPMKVIFPGDNPAVLAQRTAPLNPVMDTMGIFFDDKMAVVNASLRGEVRGIAMPLLLDLARKPVFLHDNSVPNLDSLFDPARGANAPHPFYFSDVNARADVIAFLRSLDTR